MRFLFLILLPLCLFPASASCQKSKDKKPKIEEKGPKIFEIYGDSLRRDSIVYYQTEIGYIVPDLSPKFKGAWSINVMRKQARAIPDSLHKSYIDFHDGTLFTAYVGCNKLSGSYIIKGSTIKFTILDTALTVCPETDIENWFIKLMEDRVSYFGIDEKNLYLKDVAYNTVFDCSRRKEEELKSTTSQK